MRRFLRGAAFLPLVGGLAGAAAFAQTTGVIEGRVLDSAGLPVEGAAVVARSASLQGERSVGSAADGWFRLLALPPGEYVVTAGKSGFRPVEASGVRVSLDRTVTLRMRLDPEVRESVTVSAEAPAIDTTSTTTGAAFSRQAFTTLPVTRTYQTLAVAAPGVIDGGFEDSPSIRGASAAENRYLVDGLDVTDPTMGFSASSLAFEFVDEVEVKTGGYGAEYGGALGGVLNVVTKSGGDDFHGDLFGYFNNDALQAAGETTPGFGQRLGFRKWDAGLDLGGRIVRDRLWYFLALNPAVSEEDWVNRQQHAFSTRTVRRFYAGKLSWQINATSRLAASAFGDPYTTHDTFRFGRFNFPSPLNAAGLMLEDLERGANSVSLDFTSTPARNLLLRTTVGRYSQRERATPLNGASPLYVDNSGDAAWARAQGCGDPDLLSGSQVYFAVGCVGGLHVWEEGSRSRNQVRSSVAWTPSRHELTAGFEYRGTRFEDRSHHTGPSVPALLDASGQVVDPRGAPGAEFDLFPDYFVLQVADFNSRTGGDEWALFASDRWRVTPRLSLDLGLRLDAARTSPDEPGRTVSFGFGDMVAPRVGFTWDVAGNARSKLFGHAGRFYESLPLNVTSWLSGTTRLDLYFFTYPADGSLPAMDNLGDHFGTFTIGGTVLADPKVRPSYTREYLAGFEYDLRHGLVVGLVGVARDYENGIEDIGLPSGAFWMTNPHGTYTQDPTTGAEISPPLEYPDPTRRYRSAEVWMRRRAEAWWLAGSYVLSKNEGNYPGLYRQDTGDVNPHNSSQYDFPEFLENAYGPLPNDRRHQFKLYGGREWPFRLTTGFWFEYLSGAPVSKLGAHPLYGPANRFIVDRGSGGRTDPLWHLDLHLEQSFRLGKGLSLHLLADAFNVTNQQATTAVDENWTFAAAMHTEDPAECGGPGTGPGTSCPEGNPLWATAKTFQVPRTVRLGLRLSW